MTDAQRQAATNALGYEVEDAAIQNAVAQWESMDTHALRHHLKGIRLQFDANGGRGIELADEIDSVEIALAVRKVLRT